MIMSSSPLPPLHLAENQPRSQGRAPTLGRGCQITMTNSPFSSCLKPLYQSDRGLVHNHSYENEFNLRVNEISFSCEKMGTKTRFEEEAKDNSEMAYCNNLPLSMHSY